MVTGVKMKTKHKRQLIKLNMEKIKKLYYTFEDDDFFGIKSFYALKEIKPMAKNLEIPIYSIIAEDYKGRRKIWSEYDLTEDTVKEFRIKPKVTKRNIDAEKQVEILSKRLFNHQNKANKLLTEIYAIDEQAGEEVSELLRESDF
jgi:hypothetical protein